MIENLTRTRTKAWLTIVSSPDPAQGLGPGSRDEIRLTIPRMLTPQPLQHHTYVRTTVQKRAFITL